MGQVLKEVYVLYSDSLTLALTLTLTLTLPQEIAAISRVLEEQRLAGSCELIFVVA